jgi:pimeloyl-ACP methyl ester carboxylesterase
VQILTSFWFVIVLSIALVSCGGSGKTSLDPENPIAEQGTFKSINGKTYNQKTLIQAALSKIEGLNLAPQYDVTTYKLEYLSRDSDNELVTVSGLIAIPNKNTPSPLLSFQHGTTFIDAEAPSYHLNVDTRHPEILFASLGYIVFSPDYIGYGSSKDETHPYLQKLPSADIVIDMLAAGKTWLDKENIITNPQIFLTGYSEGGYVTMAALEALQNKTGSANFTVTGAVLGAGPYDLYEALNTLLHRLSNLPEFLGDAAQEILEYFLLPDDAEIYFERTFLDRYFDKNKQDDVYHWKPSIPLKLFHGKDDKTVPIETAISTWETMTTLGADVELVKCTATPADHSPCVIPYLNYTINYFAGLRQDL